MAKQKGEVAGRIVPRVGGPSVKERKESALAQEVRDDDGR